MNVKIQHLFYCAICELVLKAVLNVEFRNFYFNCTAEKATTWREDITFGCVKPSINVLG